MQDLQEESGGPSAGATFAYFGQEEEEYKGLYPLFGLTTCLPPAMHDNERCKGEWDGCLTAQHWPSGPKDPSLGATALVPAPAGGGNITGDQTAKR